MNRLPGEAVGEVDPLRERSRLGVAEIAAIKGLATEIGLGHDVVVDYGDRERTRGYRAESRVERGKAHQHLGAVSTASHEEGPDPAIVEAGGKKVTLGLVRLHGEAPENGLRGTARNMPPAQSRAAMTGPAGWSSRPTTSEILVAWASSASSVALK
jgi:hypothetical protein